MLQYLAKIGISAVLIVAIAELSKRSSFLGGLLASIPTVSVIAMVWLYLETQDTERISALSISIFWLVIPSLALFISLPFFLRQEFSFVVSLILSMAATIICYWITLVLLGYFGIKL